MNTRHTHQDYPVHPAGHRTLGRRQARRRQLLGILLIVVGSVWLCLRLSGRAGAVPLPIGRVEGTVAMVERFNTGDLALSVPHAVYGMPATVHAWHADALVVSAPA